MKNTAHLLKGKIKFQSLFRLKNSPSTHLYTNGECNHTLFRNLCAIHYRKDLSMTALSLILFLNLQLNLPCPVFPCRLPRQLHIYAVMKPFPWGNFHGKISRLRLITRFRSIKHKPCRTSGQGDMQSQRICSFIFAIGSAAPDMKVSRLQQMLWPGLLRKIQGLP